MASLLVAANDFGHSTPSTEPAHVEQTMCIIASEAGFPLVQFEKGQVQYQSGTGLNYRNAPVTPVSGDTIVTGNTGFVRLQLSSVQHADIKPHSRITFDSSPECHGTGSRTSELVPLEVPFLSAAVRG